MTRRRMVFLIVILPYVLPFIKCSKGDQHGFNIDSMKEVSSQLVRFKLSARGLTRMDADNGAPDTLAIVVGVFNYGRTKTLKHQQNPDWQDTFEVPHIPHHFQELSISIWNEYDSDQFEEIGTVIVNTRDILQDCKVYSFGIKNGDRGTLMLKRLCVNENGEEESGLAWWTILVMVLLVLIVVLLLASCYVIGRKYGFCCPCCWCCCSSHTNDGDIVICQRSLGRRDPRNFTINRAANANNAYMVPGHTTVYPQDKNQMPRDHSIYNNNVFVGHHEPPPAYSNHFTKPQHGSKI